MNPRQEPHEAYCCSCPDAATAVESENGNHELHIVGHRYCAKAYEIREFLSRSGVKFKWEDQESPAEPQCIFPDNTTLYAPSIRDLADKLGFIHKPRFTEYDVVIIGAGPGGLSAAVYAASEGLKTALIEKDVVGGQSTTSSLIENYLGFPRGISGANLAVRARRQATKMGADILLSCSAVSAYIKDGLIHCHMDDGSELISKAGICATGIKYRKLEIPNEDKFFGVGVFYGAGAGEARFCKDQDVYVVGGGNSAGQAASYFSKFAKQVTMLVRGPNLSSTLSEYLIDRINNTSNIQVCLNSSVVELSGDHILKEITVEDHITHERKKCGCEWLFVCIGGSPNNAWSKNSRLLRDEAGYFVTGANLHKYSNPIRAWTRKREPFYLESNMPGIFAIGDVRHQSVKRIASAVGEGAVVTHFVQRYLAEVEEFGYGREDSVR